MGHFRKKTVWFTALLTCRKTQIMGIEFIISIIATIVGATSLTAFKSFFDKKSANEEKKEVNEDIEKLISTLLPKQDDKKDSDVLTLMIKNVGELREYYVINKQQARNSFSAALFISILGFILFVSGVFISYFSDSNNIIQYSTISGAIVEIIAGLFFWLYSKATKQINIFHRSLLDTEKFLTAIQLVEKVTTDQRNESYKLIINKILEMNLNNSKD